MDAQQQRLWNHHHNDHHNQLDNDYHAWLQPLRHNHHRQRNDHDHDGSALLRLHAASVLRHQQRRMYLHVLRLSGRHHHNGQSLHDNDHNDQQRHNEQHDNDLLLHDAVPVLHLLRAGMRLLRQQ